MQQNTLKLRSAGEAANLHSSGLYTSSTKYSTIR